METTQEFIDMDTGLLVDSINSQHCPTLPRVDSRYDWLEKTDGIGSIKIRFTINDLGTGQGDVNYLNLIGSATDTATDQINGWRIFLNKIYPMPLYEGITFGFGKVAAGYPNQNSFNFYFQTGITYDLVMIKIGQENRCYVNTVELSQVNVYRSTVEPDANNPIHIAGSVLANGVMNTGIITVHEVAFFNTEVDRKDGQPFTNDIDTMCQEGNYIPERLHLYVTGHWTCQERYGNMLYDCVEQYNYAKKQLVRDPNFLLGLSEFLIIREADGAGTVTYDSVNKVIELANNSIAATTLPPAIIGDYPIIVRGGIQYTVEADVESVSSAFVLRVDSIDDFVIIGNPVRSKVKGVFVEIKSFRIDPLGLVSPGSYPISSPWLFSIGKPDAVS